MQTLEVTDDQYAAIQSLREAISEDVVGEYGFVRERDAVQFLLDNLDDDAAVSVETTVESSATDDVAASVGAAIEGETDPHALEEVSYDEDDSVTDGDEASGGDEESMGELRGDPNAGTTTVGSDVDGGNGTERDANDVDDDGNGSASDSDDADATETDDASDDSSGDADDDDMLNEMMSLLETHDDKWGEAASPDYRYSVDLPDGTTEQVQTKDDVRALLFKNYR